MGDGNNEFINDKKSGRSAVDQSLTRQGAVLPSPTCAEAAYLIMAKRFTATEKWQDPWFCDLNSTDKLFWIYLLDNCNHAGIWQVNWPLAKFHLGKNISDLSSFQNRIVQLSEEKWFIPKFIEFQYGVLNPDNRAHKSVIDILEKEGAYKGLASPLLGCKVKDKDMVKDKDIKDTNIQSSNIRISKSKTNIDSHYNSIMTAWNSFCDKHTKLSKVITISGNRAKWLDARLKENLFKMDDILKAIEEQPFLIDGDSASEKHKNWHIDFDWLVKTPGKDNTANYIKVLERKYKKEKEDLLAKYIR